MSDEPLRERGKARRTARIVHAAAELWRAHGMENVSLNQIAAEAEVAPQTVYNLIGGLDALGFAVLKVALAEMDAASARTTTTGVEFALEVARTSVEVWTGDARLYRQVLVRIPQVLFNGVHLGRDTADTTILAIKQAHEAREIIPQADPERLGRAIYVSYLGALYDWACGDSDDEEFFRAAQVAVLAPVAACASEALRARLTARLLTVLAKPTEVAEA